MVPTLHGSFGVADADDDCQYSPTLYHIESVRSIMKGGRDANDAQAFKNVAKRELMERNKVTLDSTPAVLI